MIVAGFDEAGYGPRLGPLVVGCTAFEVEGAAPGDAVDLWEVLGSAVRRARKGDPSKVWVADSKAIKPLKDGLKNLELGVLSFREGPPAGTFTQLLTELGAPPDEQRALRWYEGLDQVRLPVFAWAGEVAARVERIGAACRRAGVRYAGAEVRVLDARTFNARVAATQNKAAVLGEAFVSLLKGLRARTDGPLALTVDKHGGRASYLRLLGRALPLCKLDIVHEGEEASSYAVDTPKGEVRAVFRRQAEDASLPAALASMHCKYVREVFMTQLNAWFQERIPGLKPTAGYAKDAGRFLRDVGADLPRLGVAYDAFVRTR